MNKKLCLHPTLTRKYLLPKHSLYYCCPVERSLVICFLLSCFEVRKH